MVGGADGGRALRAGYGVGRFLLLQEAGNGRFNRFVGVFDFIELLQNVCGLLQQLFPFELVDFLILLVRFGVKVEGMDLGKEGLFFSVKELVGGEARRPLTGE